MKYFVCESYRCQIDLKYAKEYYNTYHPTLYTEQADAWAELHRNFYDDSDYTVMTLDAQGIIGYANRPQSKF